MPIIRNSDQSEELEALYQSLSDRESLQYKVLNGVTIGSGQYMQQLLALINELFPHTQLWGLTSHYRLVVQNADDWRADWLIIIMAGIEGTYYFEYLLPAASRPWPGAMVRGEASTLADAKRYLLIAMRECGGWVANTELAAHLQENRLGL